MSEVEALKANGDIRSLIDCLAGAAMTREAEDALVEIGGSAVEPMADALKELRRRCDPNVWELKGDCHVAIELIRGLGRIGDRRAVAAIVWWDPIGDMSPQRKRDLVKDRKLYLKNPAAYEDPDRGVVTLWGSARPLTKIWVDALINLGGPDAEAALGGSWGLP